MMTEAVVTPWLSDRDLALRNVRYVLERRRQPGRGLRAAAGRLHRPPGATPCCASRSSCWSGSPTIPRGLMDAIADGTFGITKRPVDGGKGLDGVVELGPDAYNPALELLRRRCSPMPDGSDRPAVRGHHRRRDGADVVHPARAAGPQGRGRRAAAGHQDGHRAGDGRAQPRHRRRLHVLRRLRQREAPGRPRRRRRRGAGLPAAVVGGDQRRHPHPAAAASWSSSAPASAPTRTPSASTRSST